MKSGMFLTKDQILNFPAETYRSIYTLKLKISDTYACGISDETAARIIADYCSKK